MPNLIDEVGYDYFVDRFNSALFMSPAGKPAFISAGRFGGGDLCVTEVSGPPTKPTTEEIFIPRDFFTDMRVFAVPPWGWRQCAKGQYLTFFGRRTGTGRGISHRNITKQYSSLTLFFINNGNISREYYERLPTMASLILQPEYTPFKQGLEDLRAGKIVSFCSSPNLAVVPSVEAEQDIYYNSYKVGKVNKDGEVVCDIPLVNRAIQEYL